MGWRDENNLPVLSWLGYPFTRCWITSSSHGHTGHLHSTLHRMNSDWAHLQGDEPYIELQYIESTTCVQNTQTSVNIECVDFVVVAGSHTRFVVVTGLHMLQNLFSGCFQNVQFVEVFSPSRKSTTRCHWGAECYDVSSATLEHIRVQKCCSCWWLCGLWIAGGVKQMLNQYHNRQVCPLTCMQYYSPGSIFLPKQGHAQAVCTTPFGLKLIVGWLYQASKGGFLTWQSNPISAPFIMKIQVCIIISGIHIPITCGVSKPSFSTNIPHGASRLHHFSPTCTSQGHFTLWVPGARSSEAGSSRLFSILTWGFKHTSFPLIWILRRALGQPSLGL